MGADLMVEDCLLIWGKDQKDNDLFYISSGLFAFDGVLRQTCVFF